MLQDKSGMNRRGFFAGFLGLFGLGSVVKATQPGEVKLTAKKLITQIKVPNELSGYIDEQEEIDRLRYKIMQQYGNNPGRLLKMPQGYEYKTV